MKVEKIAHRGFWFDPKERNARGAFLEALTHGYGIETDLRDINGRIVISHDMPNGNEQTFEHFLEDYVNSGAQTTLALNIKSDGLASTVKLLLEEASVQKYFCFDMSIPDSLSYIAKGMRFFARRSDIEPDCEFTRRAEGVWLDSFSSEWYSGNEIKEILQRGQDVCIVSSELHKRSPHRLWGQLRQTIESCELEQEFDDRTLMICTDLPHEILVPQCA